MKKEPTHRIEISRALKCAARLFWTQIVVDVQEPLLDMRVVVSDHLQVAAEEGVVADVKADNGGIAITM